VLWVDISMDSQYTPKSKRNQGETFSWTPDLLLFLNSVVWCYILGVSDADPDPMPYVFGPPGSASGPVSHKYRYRSVYGSGSGSFHR
jgi:hypothetical protein